MPADTPQQFPLVLGSPVDFACVESLLRGAAFDEATILRTLQIEKMSDLSTVKPNELNLSANASTLLAILIRLFLFAEPVGKREVDEATDSQTLRAFLALDILRTGISEPTPGGGDAVYYSPIFMYPLADLLIASDRHNNPDGSPFTPPPDIVFPAISGGTLLFLKLMSMRPGECVLDLGSGTGVAALLQSSSVRRAVASDITARAAHFAKFNRLLNRRFNVEVVQGDLFEPVEGQTFDRIVAHPPYVPSLSQETIYRDGGDTGETLVRRIVEGLPKHLRPGGTYYSLSIGMDTTTGNFEERAREWLGSSRDQFDVIFALGEERSSTQFARDRAMLSDNSDPLDVERWNELFRNAGACGFVFGALVIHRRDEREVSATGEHRPLTIRQRLTENTSGSDFGWVFRWHRWRRRPGAISALSRFNPRLSPQLQVKTTYGVENGELATREVILFSGKRFLVATRAYPWIVPVLTGFDGIRTSAQLYQAARDASILPEGFGSADWIDLVSMLFERGYIEVDDDIFED